MAVSEGTSGNNPGVGTASRGSLFGYACHDTLSGQIANDYLNGAAGAAILSGGRRHDIYIVNSAVDRMLEGTPVGNDIVESSVSWTLGAGLNHLILIETRGINSPANGLNHSISGNAAYNTLQEGAVSGTFPV